jgi:chromosome partitioning protein
MRFLQSLRIPVAAVLRDSQAYVRSAETGLGLHEMKGALLQEDLESWKPLVEWLERRSGSLLPEVAEAAPAVASVGDAATEPAAASAISRLY